MCKSFIVSRVLKTVIILVFAIEASLGGGLLGHSSPIAMGGNDNLSPVMKSPNNLMDSGASVVLLIKFGLRENLKSLLKGKDIKGLDYGRFIALNREALKRKNKRDQKKKNFYQRKMNKKLPWFFIIEAVEKDGDIRVIGRVFNKGKLETYYVVFRFDKDYEDGFILKEIYREDEVEKVVKEWEQRQKNTESMVVESSEIDEQSIKDVSELEQVTVVKDQQNLIEKEGDVKIISISRLSKIFDILKRTAAIVSMVIIVFLSSVTNNNAATGNGHIVDHQAIMTKYLSAVSLDEMGSLIEISEKTGFDVRILIALVLTESDGLSAKEELTDKEKKRMTSAVGAVGPMQLMRSSIKDANKRLQEIKIIMQQGKYMGIVNQGKLEIFKEFGFEEGIIWEKVNHNHPDYNENYHFRVAGLLLKLNKFDLSRLKFVEKENGKGGYFKIRGVNEANGYDVFKAAFFAHNLSVDRLKGALRKGGPNPEEYEKHLGSETPRFSDRHEAFMEALSETYNEKLFYDLFYKVNGWEINEDRRIEKDELIVVEPSFYEKVGDIFDELNKNGDMNFILFISLFAGAIAIVSRAGKGYAEKRNNILEEDELLEWVLSGGVESDKDKEGDRVTEKSVKVYDRAKVIWRPGDALMKKNIEKVKDPVKSEISPVMDLRRYDDVETLKAVRDVGITLCPPVEMYTIYALVGFCSMDEFRYDEFKYSGRFDLNLIRKDKAGEIARHVLADIVTRNIDPETVVVQLPVVSDEDDIQEVEKLRKAGVRFVTVDVYSPESQAAKKTEKEKYRESIYAIMLLVRKFSGESSDPMLIYCLRTLVERYTGYIDDKKDMLNKYLKAIIDEDVDVSELIKVVLMYRPFEKFVDKMGKRWDAKTLVFA